jgi:DNA-binding CsgD family transcriptional regulator
MATLPPAAAHARDALIGEAKRTATLAELFGSASRRLRRLVPFDAAVWLATDPATGLPTAPTRAENFADRGFGPKECTRLWEHEFLTEDVNLYRDLGRRDIPAATLRTATRDRPARSLRYRTALQPLGFDDELRAVMRVNGNPWASVTLFRNQGRAAFCPRETELVASLSRPLAEAVRDHAQPTSPPVGPGDERAPGVILFSPDGEPTSVNDAALAWLEELAWLDESQPRFDRAEGMALGVRLPLVVAATLANARAIASDRERGIARARMRSPVSGRWLVCDASCLRDPSGKLGSTALVIEPAQGWEIAPIVAEAYALTAREQQITKLIARGGSTADIAAGLFLSTHTVRDHIKAVLHKVGASSRGELVAKLFAQHYAPVHLRPGAHELVEDGE